MTELHSVPPRSGAKTCLEHGAVCKDLEHLAGVDVDIKAQLAEVRKTLRWILLLLGIIGSGVFGGSDFLKTAIGLASAESPPAADATASVGDK